jgi:hypothetical protein
MNQGASPIPFSRILEAVAKGVDLRFVYIIVANKEVNYNASD